MGFCCKKTTSGSVTTYSEPYFCCFTFSDNNPVTVKELKAYKINTGKVNGAGFNIIPEEKNATVDGTQKKVTVYKIGVISDGKVLFGLDFKNLSGDKPTYYFYLPKQYDTQYHTEHEMIFSYNIPHFFYILWQLNVFKY